MYKNKKKIGWKKAKIKNEVDLEIIYHLILKSMAMFWIAKILNISNIKTNGL